MADAHIDIGPLSIFVYRKWKQTEDRKSIEPNGDCYLTIEARSIDGEVVKWEPKEAITISDDIIPIIDKLNSVRNLLNSLKRVMMEWDNDADK